MPVLPKRTLAQRMVSVVSDNIAQEVQRMRSNHSNVNTISNKHMFVVRPNAIERMIMQTIILEARKTDQYHPSKETTTTAFSNQN